jgi:hypothetical protein
MEKCLHSAGKSQLLRRVLCRAATLHQRLHRQPNVELPPLPAATAAPIEQHNLCAFEREHLAGYQKILLLIIG